MQKKHKYINNDPETKIRKGSHNESKIQFLRS